MGVEDHRKRVHPPPPRRPTPTATVAGTEDESPAESHPLSAPPVTWPESGFEPSGYSPSGSAWWNWGLVRGLRDLGQPYQRRVVLFWSIAIAAFVLLSFAIWAVGI
jgi:hypothetical protein